MASTDHPRPRWPNRAVPALFALGALALLPAAARACSVCGCGDPLLDAADPAASLGLLRLQLEGEYLSVQAGSEARPAALDSLSQYTLRANAVWGPTDRLNVVATVPLVQKALRAAGPGPGDTVTDVAGLGDVELGARAVLLRRVSLGAGRTQDVSISAGTSLPTGESRAVDASGERLDEHGQLGTGAWGPYAGVHYHFDQGRWYAFASLSGRVRGTNAFGYRYGTAALWSAHAQQRPVPRIALDLGVDGRYAAPDRDPGGAVASTGGTVLAASPGVFLNVAGGLWISVRAQLPFLTALAGEQRVGPTVVAGVQYQAL